MNLSKYSGMGPDRSFQYMTKDSRLVRASDMLTRMCPMRELFPKLKFLKLMSDAILAGIGSVILL